MLANYFKENSKTVKITITALKAFIGTISTAAYVQGDAKLGFWLLFSGAALDFVLNFLPPDRKPSAKMIALVILIAVGLSSCKIIKPKEITTIKDSVSVNYRTVNIDVPGAKVQNGINADSLIKAFIVAQQNGTPLPAPQTYTDPKSKAELKVWIDQYGKLQASCESKDQTVQALVAELTKTRQELKEKENIVYKTPTINYIAMAVMGTLLAISLIVNILTIKRK
jgi:hypothetical protein